MTNPSSPSHAELIYWRQRFRDEVAARNRDLTANAETVAMLCRQRDEAEAKLAAAQEEIARRSALVEKYAAAARVIGLHLREFCDDSLPYDEMIADASRKVAEELAANRACNRYTWKERAERAEQSLREKDAEIELLRGELKAAGDGSGIPNVVEQMQRQIDVERDEVKRLEERERTLREALKSAYEHVQDKAVRLQILNAVCPVSQITEADVQWARKELVALSLVSPAQEDR